MRILFLHVNKIQWKARQKAIKNSSFEELGLKEGEETDALACFICVESGDLAKINAAVDNIVDIARRIGAKRIVLYPYAHLFPEKLASPSEAVEVIKSIAKRLSKQFSVKVAAFGYYKELLVHVKGHPLAELSRRI
jgi:threonyl-tRNA synthetase